MTLDTDKLFENALRDGIREGVKQTLSQGYNSPLTKLIEAALTSQGEAIRSLFSDSMQSCIGDPEFRAEVKVAVRSVLAKTLVQRFGGELEKQVNSLKSDPSTRARITIAIEEIVKQKTS